MYNVIPTYYQLYIPIINYILEIKNRIENNQTTPH